MATGQPIMDLLLAPPGVVYALVAAVKRQHDEQEKQDRQARLRSKLNKSMGR